ncbi:MULTISPECIES: hypothetical protein [Olivibacter]|uniref:Phage terminase large subunit-like protein n=1 Tax=Olivibacter jilunii TaxID=985016 RepID=A0ABW6AZI6_9SPHI
MKTKGFPNISLHHVRAEQCNRKLSFFVKEFWNVIIHDDLVWNWHMEALCNEIQAASERVFKRLPKLHDIIVNIPPGTSKTTIISVMGTAWDFSRAPWIREFVGSYSDSAVMGISDNIRLIMRSEKYRTYFPKTIIRRDKDAGHNFKTTENGEFYAFTVGGTLTSKHADILKIDDPLNPKQAASAAELLKTNDFFDKTLPSRKTNKDVTVTELVMQRLDYNDPTGHLLKKKGEKIHHICLPGTLSDHVKPEKYKQCYINGLLDPYRLGTTVLADLKLDLGSEAYAGQIDQVPSPPGGIIWQKWLIEIPDAQFPSPSELDNYGSHWDTALTKDEENAASAHVTGGKKGVNSYIDWVDWRYLEFPELIAWMKTIPPTHYIEAKASGKSAKQTLKNMGIPAVEIKVDGGADKIARNKMATPFAEAGLVFIRKSQADKLYHDADQGILKFPKVKKDVADALAQFILFHHGKKKPGKSRASF